MPGRQAVVDPEELRRFAGQLNQFNADLKNSSDRLHAQFRHLGDTWRDQEHQRFAQEFDQMMRSVQRFVTVSQDHIPVLRRKASIVDDYLHQR